MFIPVDCFKLYMHILPTTRKTLQKSISHNTLQTTRNKARYNSDKYLDNKRSNKSDTKERESE